VSVIPGSTHNINIGPGGVPVGAKNGTPGGNTSFSDTVIAIGGLGGELMNTTALGNQMQTVVEGSATAGWRYSSQYPVMQSPNGEDGVLCPLDLSAFPELDGKKFGAAGSAGESDSGGNPPEVIYSADTGGGSGACGRRTATTEATGGSFFGAGGGGGSASKNTPGKGYQGILIIKY
jgi:hypothetical protein